MYMQEVRTCIVVDYECRPIAYACSGDGGQRHPSSVEGRKCLCPLASCDDHCEKCRAIRTRPRLSEATPWISIAKMVKNVLELAASYKECRSVLPKLGDAASAKQRPVALRGAVQP